jgi:hypothetical protein
MFLNDLKDLRRDSDEQLRLQRAQVRLQQLLLMQQYREAAARGGPLPAPADVGFGASSQNDEDGLLLYVFALAGARTRIVVEIAAGNGIECNSANLILNHGFTGLLFESNPHLVAQGRDFYARHPATRFFPPRFVEDWVTRDNVDELVTRHMFAGVLAAGPEIDLLSLDLDGNDYWVLQALTCVRPRVVILEFNAVWGARRAATVPYDPDFRAELAPVFYGGASLPAFVKLLAGRGYRLVGVEHLGFNAVFVRNDLAAGLLPERTAEECLREPIVAICQAGLAVDPRLSAHVVSRPWVDV